METLVPVAFALAIHTYTPPILFFSIAVFTTLLLWSNSKKNSAVIFMLSFIATFSTVLVLKHIFKIQRPEDALVHLTDYAFPSSHAAMSMELAFMCSWILRPLLYENQILLRLAEFSLFVCAIIIGISRIVIHVHTPLQVGVGFLVGIIIPLCVIMLIKNSRLRLLLNKVFSLERT